MKTPYRLVFALLGVLVLLAAGVYTAQAQPPLPPSQDPLVRMPGTQPNQLTLLSPDTCLACHADYDTAVEPGFLWMGSMMAQAARDPLYWATMTVAAQDSIWAVGSPNATDLCLRCHMPKGWLEGRSDTPNASAMTGGDYDGVQCDFCHHLWDPHFEDTYAGTRESNDWQGYWDEAANTGPGSGTQAQLWADDTRLFDTDLTAAIEFMNGAPFFNAANRPAASGYTEAAGGQYFVSPDGFRRGPFSDAAMLHGIQYSRFHKSRYFCAACHDVSNPILANLGADPAQPLPSETQAASAYFPVERTFSEFMLSAYGRGSGAAGLGDFSPTQFDTANPGNVVATCQDCHMSNQPGRAANLPEALLRTGDPATNESVQHPQSAQPTHDMTGGNMWVPALLASTVFGSPNYDPVNAALLRQGAATLTLDLNYGLGISPQALLAAVQRAQNQLTSAAEIEGIRYDTATGALSFRIQNQTGHKLISGYPEGRRMFVGIKVYNAANSLIYEINPYDATVGTLKGLNAAGSPSLGANEVYNDALVYEAVMSSSLTDEAETKHFALGDGRAKDNRIPPLGFDIANAAARHTEPAWQGAIAPAYFNAGEYAGGYDAVNVTLPASASGIEINLYYQTTSREYVNFLRNEINGGGPTTLPDPNPATPQNEAYIAQSDPFFNQLAAWGDTMWQLWEHNKTLPGAAPVLMASAQVTAGNTCYVYDVQPDVRHNNPAACDGDVDVVDIQRVSGCWLHSLDGICPPGLDVNQSGAIDLNDIVAVAGAWGWQQ